MGVDLDDEWGHEQAGNNIYIMNDNAAEAAQGTRELRNAADGARARICWMTVITPPTLPPPPEKMIPERPR